MSMEPSTFKPFFLGVNRQNFIKTSVVIFLSAEEERKHSALAFSFLHPKGVLKENGNIFFIGLLIKTFEVIIISVFNFLVTYLDSEILKTNDISHSPSCFIIRSILLTSQPG